MSRVAVIGLGAMGSAIADALLAEKHAVTVWNRAAERAQRFQDTGARIALSLEEAIESSDTVLVCISNYAATQSLFETPAAKAQLAGRTLIQFSTGTPREARVLEKWSRAAGARYLDCAILAYPVEVGNDALVAVAGDHPTWESQQTLLASLSSDLRYLGDAVGAAAALDVAVLSYYVCAHLGLVHGALICEAENVPPEMLANVIADSLPSDTQELRKLGSALQAEQFANAEASIGTYNGVIERIIAQAEDAEIDAQIPRFARSIYARGMASGLDDEEVVALVKVLRERRGRAKRT